jgi:rhomboid-like protein
MPAATVDLSAEQITKIFGPGISFDTGMHILQELQMRRVSGSLQDKGIDLPELEEVTETQALAGLEWLRDNFPVDEEAAAKEWSQFEIERLSLAIEEQAERVGLYKKLFEPEEEVETSPQPKQVTNVYGDSVLVQRQKELKAKEAAEEEKAKEEAASKGQPAEEYKGRYLVLAKGQDIGMHPARARPRTSILTTKQTSEERRTGY